MEMFAKSYRPSHTILVSLLLSLQTISISYASLTYTQKALGNSDSFNANKRKNKTRKAYGKETSNISPPIPITITNLEDIGNAATSSIATGYTWTGTALTQELYPTLSNSLALGLVFVSEKLGNPLAMSTSIAVQTGTPTMGPYSPSSVITYDLTDTTAYVYSSIMFPETILITNFLNTNSSTQSVFANQNGYAMGVPAQNLANKQASDSQASVS
ncbi:MAG: hypothetical protein VW868_09105, partial [Bacteroidota bacterium]